MARLKDATQPMDKTNLIPVSPPAVTPRPVLNASADPEFSSLSIAPIPPALGTNTDAGRQFYRTGVSQVRMFPFPPQASAATGSQIASHVAPVAKIADASAIAAQGAAAGVETINGSTAVAVALPAAFTARGLIDDYSFLKEKQWNYSDCKANCSDSGSLIIKNVVATIGLIRGRAFGNCRLLFLAYRKMRFARFLNG